MINYATYTTKTFERPFSAWHNAADKLNQILEGAQVQKALKIIAGVLFAIMASALIIYLGMRYNESRIAYQYLQVVTQSVPVSSQR